MQELRWRLSWMKKCRVMIEIVRKVCWEKSELSKYQDEELIVNKKWVLKRGYKTLNLTRAKNCRTHELSQNGCVDPYHTQNRVVGLVQQLLNIYEGDEGPTLLFPHHVPNGRQTNALDIDEITARQFSCGLKRFKLDTIRDVLRTTFDFVDG